MDDLERFQEIAEEPSRLYAIGDIHGCVSETEILLDYLAEKEKLTEQDRVIFIGDYIDRGPNSKEVISLLIDFQKNYPNTIFLRGNHEDMLLSFLGFDGSEGKVYLVNGGAPTLKSYGLKPSAKPEEMLEVFPREHISFLMGLARYIIFPRWIFVHAGLNPLRDLRGQLDQDIFWIREDFIDNIHHFDREIIYGHTPYLDLMIDNPYKIGIDTGLVYANKLTCIELCEQRVLQIERSKKKVQISKFSDKLKNTEFSPERNP